MGVHVNGVATGALAARSVHGVGASHSQARTSSRPSGELPMPEGPCSSQAWPRWASKVVRCAAIQGASAGIIGRQVLKRQLLAWATMMDNHPLRTNTLVSLLPYPVAVLAASMRAKR